MTQENTEQFVMLNTAEIQADSLKRFMLALGYHAEGTTNGRVRFATDNPDLKGTSKLGFNTAIRLHNIGVEGWEEFEQGLYRVKDSDLDLMITAVDLIDVYARRLVLNCKYQQNKRVPGGVQLQGNMIKVAHPIFVSAFGL